VIENLSSCFLTLNDKLLSHLSCDKHPVLAQSIKDSMQEFKSIVEASGTDRSPSGEADEAGESRMDSVSTPQPGVVTQGFTSNAATPIPSAQLPEHQPYNTKASSQVAATKATSLDMAFQNFSGPAFLGLARSPNAAGKSTSNYEALAARIYETTVRRAYQLVQSSTESDHLFRRVFKSYYLLHPPGQVRSAVAQMLQDDRYTVYDERGNGSDEWMSAMQVAVYCCQQGFTFVPETDRLAMPAPRRDGNGHGFETVRAGQVNGYIIVDVAKLIEGVFSWP
jgi:hypothetical protein